MESPKENGKTGVCLSIAIPVVFALLSASNQVFAVPPPAAATCRISCTVANIAEWADAGFQDIHLAELTPGSSEVSGSSSLRLYTNSDVKITADNSAAAQLSKDASHKLATEYKLEYDASGTNGTGGATVVWSDYDSFLREGSIVTHAGGDGAVEIILSVRVSKDKWAADDAGQYTATQTLTACWQ